MFYVSPPRGKDLNTNGEACKGRGPVSYGASDEPGRGLSQASAHRLPWGPGRNCHGARLGPPHGQVL